MPVAAPLRTAPDDRELLARMAPPVDFIELATGRREVALFPVLR